MEFLYADARRYFALLMNIFLLFLVHFARTKESTLIIMYFDHFQRNFRIYLLLLRSKRHEQVQTSMLHSTAHRRRMRSNVQQSALCEFEIGFGPHVD